MARLEEVGEHNSGDDETISNTCLLHSCFNFLIGGPDKSTRRTHGPIDMVYSMGRGGGGTGVNVLVSNRDVLSGMETAGNCALICMPRQIKAR